MTIMTIHFQSKRMLICMTATIRLCHHFNFDDIHQHYFDPRMVDGYIECHVSDILLSLPPFY